MANENGTATPAETPAPAETSAEEENTPVEDNSVVDETAVFAGLGEVLDEGDEDDFEIDPEVKDQALTSENLETQTDAGGESKGKTPPPPVSKASEDPAAAPAKTDEEKPASPDGEKSAAPTQEDQSQKPEPSQDAQPTGEEGSLIDELVKNKDAYVSDLAQSNYQLTDEVVELIQEKPQDVLPQMLATAHVNAFKSAVDYVHQVMPGFIQSVMRAQTQSDSRLNSFLETYPSLKPHRAEVLKAATEIRKLNPNMPLDEFSKKVAVYSAAMLGVDLTAPVAENGGAGAPTPSPSVPPSPVTTSVPVAPISAPQVPSNPWEIPEDVE